MVTTQTDTAAKHAKFKGQCERHALDADAGIMVTVPGPDADPEAHVFVTDDVSRDRRERLMAEVFRGARAQWVKTQRPAAHLLGASGMPNVPDIKPEAERPSLDDVETSADGEFVTALEDSYAELVIVTQVERVEWADDEGAETAGGYGADVKSHDLLDGLFEAVETFVLA